MALTDSLISYWKLDEASGNALDAHGSNTLTDNNSVASATGKINNGRDFEASSSQFFSHTDNADLSVGNIDFTFSAWFKAESLSNQATLLSKDDATNNLAYDIFYDAPNLSLRFRVSSGAGFANLTSVLCNVDISTVATWHFVVGWHDSVSDLIRIQIDDSTPVDLSYSLGSYDEAGDFKLGTGGLGGPWDGIIDEVGFWKRVLTSTERTSLYNSGAGLAYPFGGGTGPTVLELVTIADTVNSNLRSFINVTE